MSQGKARIFLSYARGDDEAFVRRLHADLVAAGFDVWFDRVSMPSRELSFYQEIRDAIATSDRVLLVVGPKAVVSEYVTQEWQAALELCKCVNPIVRLDGVGHGGERVDGYGLIPEELTLVHAEDFRRDAEYAEHLANLVRQLFDAVPPLGKLIAVPSLPVHYRAQPERLKQLRETILVDLRSPVVVTGSATKVGVQGMGGIGKSVLAAALARDQQVRLAFPDGICWVDVGQQPNVVELQRRLASLLGDPALFDNVYAGKQVLRELLANRQVLIVLDNVWARKDADAFDVLGPRCKLMLTTRDAGLVTSLAGTGYQVQFPTEAEAMALLATAAGAEIGALPPEARAVAGECGKLPLALALCGGMVRAGISWRDVLDALREHDLEFPSDEHTAEEQHRSIWRAIEVSVSVLPEDQRKRFAELGVFVAGIKVPEAAVVTLWTHTSGMSERAARKLLVDFKQRSLIQLERPVGDGGVAEGGSGAPALVGLHDLMYDFAVRSGLTLCGTAAEQHGELTEAYWGKCSDGWASGPNDGYFLEHLADHLIGAGRGGEFVDLVFELPWLEAKNQAGLALALPGDFAAAARIARADDARRRLLPLIEEAIRRDIHFIARHAQDYPQGLFQCLWNSCWWYDCAEAASHYDPPSGGWGPQGAPWDRVGPKLCELVARWHAERSAANPGFVWLRSLRPPQYGLDSPWLTTLYGHDAGVQSVHYSPDGRKLVSASQDKTVRVWDATTGETLAVLNGHNGWVHTVRFSPDGRLIASGSSDCTVRVWDGISGRELVAFREHTNAVLSISFAPDGRHLASAAADGTVRLWDVLGGTESKVMYNEESICRVSFSPDGQRLAIGTFGAIHIVSLTDGRRLAVLELPGKSGWTYGLCFGGSDQILACGTSDNTVLVFDMETSQIAVGLRANDVSMHPSLIDETAMSEVLDVSFASNGQWLASGSGSGSVRVWDVASRLERVLMRGHRDRVYSVSFSPDGKRVASGSRDRTVRIWSTEVARKMLILHGHADWVFALAVSHDGKRVASVSKDHTTRVWDITSGRQLAVLRDSQEVFRRVVFSDDDAVIITQAPKGTRRLWDATSFKPIESNSVGPIALIAPVDGPRFRLLARDPQSLAEMPQTESAVHDSLTRREVAWYPVGVYDSVAHSCGHLWAGVVANYVAILRLEGAVEHARVN